jgi:FkbM family methyltransferase
MGKIRNYLLSETNKLIEKRFSSLEQKLNNLELNTPKDQVFNYQVEGHIPGLLFIKSNGIRIFLDPRDPYITVHYLQVGTWEPQITNYLKTLCKTFESSKKGKKFIDVGANIGLHSMDAQKMGFVVYAYEPDPTSYKFLVLNSNVNAIPINHKQIALTCKAGEFDFSISLESSGMSGLTQSDSGTGFAARSVSNEKSFQTIQVKATTLDLEFANDVFGNTDDFYVIKIDTEGSEGQVLQGATNSLNKLNCYVLICEMHLDNKNLIKSVNDIVHLETKKGKVVKIFLLRFEQEAIPLDHLNPDSWHQYGYGDIAIQIGF